MSTLFPKMTIAEARAFVKDRTKEEATAELVAACQRLVKDACWYPYRSRIDVLRIPLARLKHAK